MKIDLVASEPHYFQHMLPVFNALPDHLRGTIQPLAAPGRAQRPPFGHVALVAGWQDVEPLRGRSAMIYVEHGAGQTYANFAHHPSYSGAGGTRHAGVLGFIAPSETVARRWTSAPSVAVGCPKMDEWIGAPQPVEPAVCFAWHWDCRVAPESRTALPHYLAALPAIAHRYRSQGFKVYAHWHPKWRGQSGAEWEQAYGIEPLTTDREVFEKASILLVDNSSLAYEFALLGRPAVSLNAPWYRRDVEHGLRFWSDIPGIQIDGPEELLCLNLWDLLHDTDLRLHSERERVRALSKVYATQDGTASARAAAWIAELMAKV